MYMKNKNFRKLKYMQANPENAGFCTIYPTASGPDPWPIFFHLASVSTLHLLFQNSLLLSKVLKALQRQGYTLTGLTTLPKNRET